MPPCPRPSSPALYALAGLAVLLSGASPAPGDGDRTPWTASRVVGTPDPPPPYVAEPAFPKLEIRQPIALVAAPGTRRLFVAELNGKILSFPDDPRVDRSDLALDLAKVRPGFGNLYGLAFHPRFAENRQVYLCYAMGGDKPDGTRVSRFTLSRDDPPKIIAGSETILLTFLSGGHNGGCLQFGPDGFLYISTGDAAAPSPPDPLKTGQDLSDLLSSILRIDVDRAEADRPYRIPPDNPFVKTPGARPEIWAYGFRNPWRMSFDRANGDLWVGDVGWELWEMIYRVERGGNYGWSLVEGRQPVRPDGAKGPTPILPPVVDHPHSEAASITGGYVYRGKRLGDLSGTYLYGDFQSGKMWGLRHDGQKVTWRGEIADTGLQLVAFGESADGEIYLLNLEGAFGVYRLMPNPANGRAQGFPRALSATGLFTSTKEQTPAPGVVPYAIHAPMWSDGATAERWLAIPGQGRIAVEPNGSWGLPDGSVLARTVSMETTAGDPKTRRRVETQILHREAGTWRPYTYAWDDTQTDATLVDAAGGTRPLTVRDERAPGGRRERPYRIAARSECVLCHNPWAGLGVANYGRQSASPLGFHAGQLDGDATRSLERQGLFASAPKPGPIPRLTNPYDESADLTARARSYLHVNCAHCHQPNAGGTTTIALLASLPLDQTHTVGQTPMQGGFGLPLAKILAPGDPTRSVLYYRIAKTGAGRMPRVGSQEVDVRGTRLIADWIASLEPSAKEDASEETSARRIVRGGSDAERAEGLRRLIGSTRGALSLVRAVDRGEVPEPLVRDVAIRSREPISPEVRDLLERFLPDSDRVKRLGDAIDPSAILSLSGDPARGRALFFSEAATQCKGCHRVGGIGSTLGPELDAIGAKYTRPELLRHIVQPSLVVDPKFAQHAIAMKDGRTVTGLLAEETDAEVVLRDAQDRPMRLAKSEIEQRGTRPGSLMPDGLLRDLTASQAADLLEFLGSLKGDATKTGSR